MDSAIVAALISGGVGALGIVGTVTTSIVGSRNTRRATERTVEAGAQANRATLLAAREDRLWERRAAAYEQMLTVLLHRRAKRNYDSQSLRVDPEEPESSLNAFYRDYPLPGLFETESRLVAYATDEVRTAYEASRDAHSRAQVRSFRVSRLLEEDEAAHMARNPRPGPDPQTVRAAEDALRAGVKAANEADDALIQVIREALRARPEAAMPPVEVPAVRPGHWYRRKALEG